MSSPLPPAPEDPNAAEIAYWNGPGGQRWLKRQPLQDALLAPIAEILLQRAVPRPGEYVLDIGCGCGATAFELARRVGPNGQVLGLDVSAPLLQRARELAPVGLPVRFELADATLFGFERGRADLLCSRFGVMFFADPARSFVNMRGGLRSGGRLAFACWRQARENPWLMVPLQQAYRHVPRLPEVGPEDPGPFSLADESRVRRVLQQAGLVDVRLERVDLAIDLATGRGLESAVDAAISIGPTSRALDGQPDELRRAATESIRSTLAQHQVGDAVPLAAALWIVTASNP